MNRKGPLGEIRYAAKRLKSSTLLSLVCRNTILCIRRPIYASAVQGSIRESLTIQLQRLQGEVRPESAIAIMYPARQGRAEIAQLFVACSAS